MATISIFACLSLTVLFIFTRKIFINVKKDDILKIEIHFPVFALLLTEKKEEKQKSDKKPSYRNIVRLIREIPGKLSSCEVIIKSITLPIKSAPDSPGAFTKPFIVQSLIYSALAYIDAKVQKLTVYNGAVKSSAEARSFCCDITVKGRLFRLLTAAVTVYLRTRKNARYMHGR